MRNGFTRVCLLLALLLLVSTDSHSSTFVVPDDFALQVALDSAASGDSVLIRSGTYAGSFGFSGKNLFIVGEAGADNTILDGQNAARVLTIGAGVTAATQLVGLTFTHGRAAGGGVYVEESSGATIRNCSFLSNYSPGFEGGPGGGLYAGQGSTVTVEDCLFDGNRGGLGVGIYAWAASMTIRGCTFRHGFGRIGTAIFLQASSFVVERCLVYDNDSWTDGGTVSIYSSSGDLRECTIAFNRDPDAALFLYNDQPTARVEKCIVSNNTGWGAAIWQGTASCIDSWGNPSGNFDPPGLEGTTGNFSADPLFCDAASDDFTLRNISPCLPGQHPSGDACGRIGVFDQGCQVIPVLPSTWSSIKARLR